MELDSHDKAQDERAGEIRGFGADFSDWMLRVETPVGEPCHLCQTAITILDVGHTMIRAAETVSRVAVHRECFLGSILPDRETSGGA